MAKKSENKKGVRMKTKLLSLLLVATLLAATLTSCLPFGDLSGLGGGTEEEPSTGVFHRLGMTITLTPDFVDNSKVKQFTYTSDTCTVTGYRHNFSEIEVADGAPFPTIVDFANLYNPTPDSHSALLGTDALYFEYHQTLGNTMVLAVVYEDVDAFYLVQFICETYLYESMRDTFMGWAKTVTFDE